jgi:hypothetical protein
MGNPWTPGRWEYDAGETKDGKAGFFVHVNGAGIWSDQDNDGGVCSLPDARLIAAAPEMAEALRLWLAYDSGADDVSMMIRYAEALEATKAIYARIRGDAP